MALYRSWVYLLPKSLYLRDQMSTIIWSRINLSNPYLNLFFHFWELADDDHFWPQVFLLFKICWQVFLTRQNLVTSFFDLSKFVDKFFWLVKICRLGKILPHMSWLEKSTSAVRKTDVSWHNYGPFQPLNTIVLWCLRGFQVDLHCAKRRKSLSWL